MAGHLRALLRSAVRSPDAPLASLPMMGDDERAKLWRLSVTRVTARFGRTGISERSAAARRAPRTVFASVEISQ